MRLHVGRWMRRGILIGGAAVLAAALLPGTPAWALPTCGSVLTTNTTLTADLVCAGDGLIIGADAITLNLNGHTIKGNGTGDGIADGFAGRFNNVTIRNGRVTGFAFNVHLFSVHDITLRSLRLTSASTGLRVSFSTNVTLTSSAVTSAQVRVNDSPHATISHSRFTSSPVSYDSSSNLSTFNHNTVTDSPLTLFEVDGTVVADNKFTRSGILSYASSRHGVFRDNLIEGADIGLKVADVAPGTQIMHNSFRNNRIGLFVNSGPLALDGTGITDNSFTNNAAAGALIESVNTLGLPSTVTIQENKFADNGLAPAGLTDHLGKPVADGLHIAVPAGALILVGDNATTHNGSFGIYAIPGTVTDTGGNTSVANPNGCLGVTC